MQRVRMSLPYYNEFGWEPVVICVDEKYVEGYTDPLLSTTIPDTIEVHKVKAWPVKLTRRFGFGSLSIRSFWFFRKKGNELLRKQKFDLIYFSTTAFHVCRLGPYWKKKFKIPFIIDMQDPWRSDFYLDKPSSERPPKFFIAYNIDKFLERRTIPKANGIISVSEGYREILMSRYKSLTKKQFKIIPFGVSLYDFEIMQKYVTGSRIKLSADKINIVYIGRGGYDMRFALEIVFKAFKKGLELSPEIFSKIHFYFIGTSYAAAGFGKKTITPLAQKLNIGDYVTEVTDRIPYFETLYLLKNANILLVPGSTDTSYTASKIYPYILAKKPLLAVFNKNSSVINVLNDLSIKSYVSFENTQASEDFVDECFEKLNILIENNEEKTVLNEDVFYPYTAKEKTVQQVDFFNTILELK